MRPLLKDYVNWKLTHGKKDGIAEGYPLVLEKCKTNSQMKDFKIFGNVGKNLYHGDFYYNGNQANTITLANSGSVMTMNGTCTANVNATGKSSDGIALKAGVTYTVSFNYLYGEMVSGGMTIGLFNLTTKTWYKFNNNNVAATLNTSKYINGFTKSFTPDADVVVTINCILAAGEYNNLQFGIQIEEGSSATVYEPYSCVGDLTRNIYSADSVYLVEQGWNLDKETIVATKTDRSVTTVTKSTASYGNIIMYLGAAKDYAGRTLCATWTTGYANMRMDLTGLTIRANTNSTEIIFGTTTVWNEVENGYYSIVTVPENIDEISSTAVIGFRLYAQNFTAGEIFTIDNIMIYEGSEPLPYEPPNKYKLPIVQRDVETHTLYLDAPLNADDVLDVGEHMELPVLTSATTVFETDTSVKPSKMYAKYKKK